jgi:hypothetical protein
MPSCSRKPFLDNLAVHRNGKSAVLITTRKVCRSEVRLPILPRRQVILPVPPPIRSLGSTTKAFAATEIAATHPGYLIVQIGCCSFSGSLKKASPLNIIIDSGFVPENLSLNWVAGYRLTYHKIDWSFNPEYFLLAALFQGRNPGHSTPFGFLFSSCKRFLYLDGSRS